MNSVAAEFRRPRALERGLMEVPMMMGCEAKGWAPIVGKGGNGSSAGRGNDWLFRSAGEVVAPWHRKVKPATRDDGGSHVFSKLGSGADLGRCA